FLPGFSYSASPTEQASLTDGAVWTQRELAFSLSPGALKTITATNPVIKAPNVAGRTVTIEAAAGIGETADTVSGGVATPGISIPADLDPSLLTDDQKVALATAERSDLHLLVDKVVLPPGVSYADLTPQQQAEFDAAKSYTNIDIALGATTLGTP